MPRPYGGYGVCEAGVRFTVLVIYHRHQHSRLLTTRRLLCDEVPDYPWLHDGSCRIQHKEK